LTRLLLGFATGLLGCALAPEGSPSRLAAVLPRGRSLPRPPSCCNQRVRQQKEKRKSKKEANKAYPNTSPASPKHRPGAYPRFLKVQRKTQLVNTKTMGTQTPTQPWFDSLSPYRAPRRTAVWVRIISPTDCERL